MMNDESLLQLVYISTAAKNITTQDIDRILEKARVFNAQQRITGLLLYKDGLFLQVLEGDADAVLKLYDHICTNTLHHNVRMLSQKFIPKREFGFWSMGYVDAIGEHPKIEGNLEQGTTSDEAPEMTAKRFVAFFQGGYWDKA
jgi:hypothetical protein